MPDITQFAQLGVAGLSVYLMYRISSNHIDHATRAIEKNTIIIGELSVAIRGLTNFLKRKQK